MVDKHHARRAFLSHLGTGATAAGLTVLSGRPAAAQSAERSEWHPKRHQADDWLDRIPGVHRLLFDTTHPEGFGEALTFANNYYAANQSGYGLNDADLAVVIVARHDSAPFAYTEAMWVKYGPSFVERSGFVDPSTKQPPAVNVYRARMEGLIKRGSHFAVCQLSTRRLAGGIAGASRTDADSVYNELAANLVANAHMVPAGIIAVNRAQERGYSFTHAG